MKSRLRILNTVLVLLLITPPLLPSEKAINTAMLKIINTDGDETSCTVSKDRKLIIFARKPKNARNSDLYFSEYRGGKWSEPKPAAELNSDADELSPYLSADGKTIYFSSNRQGSLKSGSATIPSFDIYYSEKKDGKWDKPLQLFGAVNTMDDELWPSLSGDGKTIYFTRTSAAGSKSLIISVTKKDDFWEDVQTVRVTGDSKLKISTAARSVNRDAYIFTAYKEGSTSRNIFFSTISDGNGGKATEDPALNSDGDVTSFCELSGSEILVSANSGGISGSYDIFLKKISQTVTEGITESNIVIRAETKDYTSSEGVNIKLLFFKSEKAGAGPDRSETKQPDNSGKIKLTVTSDIKRIVALPGNPDMKEFALEIFPGKNAATPVITIEKKSEKEFKIRPVYFRFNSAELQITDIPFLHELIEYMRKNEKTNLSIEGYADGIGSYRANKNISLARAETVKDYLVKMGIDKKRLETRGNGFVKEQPEDTLQYSRRVDFIIRE